MSNTIHLPGYPIVLGPLSETLSEWLQGNSYAHIFVVADANAQASRIVTTLLPEAEVVVVECPPPNGQAGGAERLKNLATCEQIWAAMLQARLDRRALVINLGGGVIGDMGGFCAATFKRGVDFVQVPTTLLAMTDAAIGGKLGVDFLGVKNAIGVFQNPCAVFVDPVFLETLPARELRSGFAEVIKHARIGDASLWEKIRTMPGSSLSPGAMSVAEWTAILEASIAVKAQVVAMDPREHGLRALLNFGHTIGHAVESVFLETNAPLTHGEAVAIGMICEALMGPDDGADVFLRFFGHCPIPENSFPDLWERMLNDKKNTSGTVRMAVPDVEPFSLQLLELTRDAAYHHIQHYNRLVQ
ncbi:MAG: 3-dehydroquinate synthase family protein [Saprospiraceae bacterium]